MKQFLKNKYPKILRVYYKIRFYIRFFYIKQVRHHIFWLINNGDNKLYKNLYLKKNDLFLDVGSYKGEVINKIRDLYDCNIIGFEPEKSNFNYLEQKFKKYKHIKIYDYGLSNFTGESYLFTDYGNSSLSLNRNNNKAGLKVKIKNISEFIREQNIKVINVLKLNVEGAEYEILNELINTGYIKNIKVLIIQFHLINDFSKLHRLNIIKKLEKTHNNKFSYYFVWEKWILKE